MELVEHNAAGDMGEGVEFAREMSELGRHRDLDGAVGLFIGLQLVPPSVVVGLHGGDFRLPWVIGWSHGPEAVALHRRKTMHCSSGFHSNGPADGDLHRRGW